MRRRRVALSQPVRKGRADGPTKRRPAASEHESLLQLQRDAGNEAVSELLTVQPSILPGALRHDEGTPEQIANAISGGDPADVKAIDNFSNASASQKLQLAGVLLDKTDWLGPFDKRALARIFNSFGDLEDLDENAVTVLKRCVDRGFSLHDLSRYDNLVLDFRSELKQRALDNLGDNIELIIKEAARLGASGDKPPTEEQDSALREQQELAQEILDAKRLMAACRKITVAHGGLLGDPSMFGKAILFDPQAEPGAPGIDPVKAPDAGRHEMPWSTVYAQYSGLGKAVASVLNQNPALYALTSLTEDDPGSPPKPGEDPRLTYGGRQRITGFQNLDIEAARKKVRDAFTELYNNSRMTMVKTMSGDLNPLQFDTLVRRFLKGDEGPRWAKPYPKVAAQAAVAEAESSFDKTMAEIGLALLLVSVAIGTAGGATPVLGAILAAANVGTAAAGAAIATLNANDLQTASQSAASGQTAIVSPEQAGKAELDAMMYQFSAILAIVGEGASVLLTPAGALGAIDNLAAVDSMAPAAQATAISEALESMEPGQVALRAGKPPEELLAIVAPHAAEDPAAAAATNKLRDFLNRFSSPLIGPTAGGDKTVAALLRQAKMTIREYWSKVYGLGLREVDTVSLHTGMGDAELTYIKLIEDTPGREAGIYRNTRTGEHAVVQGSGDWKGGMVQHMDALPEAAGDHWVLLEHYHPERNWALQFPSGGINNGQPFGDFAVLLQDYGETNVVGVMQGQPSTAITSKVTARIRYRDPVSGQYHFTTYGYDPTRGPVGAFFVEAETETGAMVEYSFNTIGGIAGARAEYEAHLAGIARGVPIVQAVP